MNSLASQLSIVAGICGLVLLGWIIRSRSGLALLFFFFLFAFAFRSFSSVYIDAAGPVYSEQLFSNVGPGNSAVVILLIYGSFIGSMLWTFRRERVHRATAAPVHPVAIHSNETASNIMFYAYLTFVIALYVDFLRIGVIPLFSGHERFEYTKDYGGFFHLRLMEWGTILAFQLGYFYANGISTRGSSDSRYLKLLTAIFIYLFLAGHRFSHFYSYSAFFVMPVGMAMLAREGKGRLAGFKTLAVKLSKMEWIVTGLFVAAIVVYAIYRSYYITRFQGVANPTDRLAERLLIQQGEMWWATFSRVFISGEWNPRETFDYLFRNPIVEDVNSTTPYLMYLAIGEAAVGAVLGGTNYLGGYPEILFELAGPYWGISIILLVNLLITEFLFQVSNLVWRKRWISVMAISFLVYTFSIFFISGMLNFLTSWTFWVKLSIVMVCILAGNRFANSSRPIVIRRPLTWSQRAMTDDAA